MATMTEVNNKITELADSVREKTGRTDTLTLDEMSTALNAVAEKSSTDLTVSNATITVPAGNYKTAATKSIATTTQATPTLSVNSSGVVTASVTQSAKGYIAAGTKNATKQLTVQAAQTITPSVSDQTITSGKYLTGAQTIKGDANLISSNIKQGTTIFGITGAQASGDFNIQVVGGTTQPTNPIENTIWINTSNDITKWTVSGFEPASPIEGQVWIQSISTVSEYSDEVILNILNDGFYEIRIGIIYQYINGEWVSKTNQIYLDGEWKEISFKVFYNKGAQCTSVTGGWTTNGFYRESDGSISLLSPTINSDHIYLEGAYNTSVPREDICPICTANKIPMANLSHIYADIEFVNSGSLWLQVSNTKQVNAQLAYVEANGGLTTQTMKLSVKDITEDCYIIIRAQGTQGQGYTPKAKIYKVYSD